MRRVHSYLFDEGRLTPIWSTGPCWAHLAAWLGVTIAYYGLAIEGWARRFLTDDPRPLSRREMLPPTWPFGDTAAPARGRGRGVR